MRLAGGRMVVTICLATLLLNPLVTHPQEARAAQACPSSLTWHTEAIQAHSTGTGFQFTEHELDPPFSGLWDVAAGPDNRIWFSGLSTRKIGRISTSGNVEAIDVGANSSGPVMHAGPDGNIWFADEDQIGRVSPTGEVTGRFDYDGYGNDITLGPDDNLWFTNFDKQRIGRVTLDGTITEFGPLESYPYFLSAGPDGNVWFSEKDGPIIGCITTAGDFHEYELPRYYGSPEGVAKLGGDIWFTLRGRIARIDLDSGDVFPYQLPGQFYEPLLMTRGPDSALWFSNYHSNLVGRLTKNGTFTEFSFPADSLREVADLVAGPDGDMWVTDYRSLLEIHLDQLQPCSIVGSDGPDALIGTSQSDVICGLGGNDRINGREGDDTLIGGAGRDRVVYESFLQGPLTVNLLEGVSTGAGTDKLVSIEDAEGGPKDDQLIGDFLQNRLVGKGGDDDIRSLQPFLPDQLEGGRGDDSFQGVAEQIAGGPGDDTVVAVQSEYSTRMEFRGGLGIDSIDYRLGWPRGIRADLATGTIRLCEFTQYVGGDRQLVCDSEDMVRGVENLVGTKYKDVLGGSRQVNALSGLAGKDRILAKKADDSLRGGGDDDRLDGGRGTDDCRGGQGSDKLVECE